MLIELQEFFDYLRKGEFWIPTCISCKKKVWPPYRHCSVCLSKTKLRKIKGKGTLVEWTTSHLKNIQNKFGIVDMSGIKVLGSISGEPITRGMRVRMTKCGISDNGIPYYHFEPD